MRRLRWLLVPVLVVPLGWLLFTGFERDPRAIASPLIGQPAPQWSSTTLDGETLTAGDLSGRPYVVNFWASWCVPACVDEHPVLAAAQAEHGHELAMVGVLVNDDADSARAFLGRYGDTGYPTVVDEAGRVAIDFGVTGPPESFFVDAEGVVRAKHTGPLDDAGMAEKLAAIGVGS